MMLKKYKRVRNLYLRYGDPKFVLFASFSFAAKNQGWTDDEIREVIHNANDHEYKNLFNILKKYC